MAQTISAPLKGKVAVITRGSRGIGASIAQVFAHQGCTHIATTYISNKDKAEDVLSSIRKEYPNIKTHTIASDVCDPTYGETVIEEALKGLGVDHIDIAVANAASIDMAKWPPVAELSHELWMHEMTGLAWGPVSLARAAIKHMPTGGRIIMLSSVSSKLAAGDQFVSYAAGKAAMEAASKQLAKSYGVKHGVTVNTISVGPTRTDAFTAGKELAGDHWETWAASMTLLERIAQPEEVANIVAFVASPGAGWITGNQIPANGGAAHMLQS